jgi:hypothetical protein
MWGVQGASKLMWPELLCMVLEIVQETTFNHPPPPIQIWTQRFQVIQVEVVDNVVGVVVAVGGVLGLGVYKGVPMMVRTYYHRILDYQAAKVEPQTLILCTSASPCLDRVSNTIFPVYCSNMIRPLQSIYAPRVYISKSGS